MWYKREERQYRISLFFSCASLAGAFGGILAWGISHMRGVGNYSGWRWIFILVRILLANARISKTNKAAGRLAYHRGCSSGLLVHLQLSGYGVVAV